MGEGEGIYTNPSLLCGHIDTDRKKTRLSQDVRVQKFKRSPVCLNQKYARPVCLSAA